MRVTENWMDRGGDRTNIGGELRVIPGGKLTLEDGATIEGDGAADLAVAATETVLGGVKAATKGAGDTVEAKIDATSKKLYVPAYPDEYTLTAATEATLGGVLKVANIAGLESGATTDQLRVALNLVIAALISAGVMAASAPE